MKLVQSKVLFVLSGFRKDPSVSVCVNRNVVSVVSGLKKKSIKLGTDVFKGSIVKNGGKGRWSLLNLRRSLYVTKGRKLIHS